jgi:hypothetical protein
MSQPSSIVSRIFNVTSWIFYVPGLLCAVAAIVTAVWMAIYANGAGANSGSSAGWTYLFPMMFGVGGLALTVVGFILGIIGKATRKTARA